MKAKILMNVNFMPTYSNMANSHNYSNNYPSNYQPVFHPNYPNLSQPSKEANNTMGFRTNNQKIDINYEN